MCAVAVFLPSGSNGGVKSSTLCTRAPQGAPFLPRTALLIFGMVTDTASLVPLYESNDVYLVLDELVTFGRVWRELSEEAANEQTVLELIANGEFHRPMRVIMFNTAEGWSRDETVAMGFKLLQ